MARVAHIPATSHGENMLTARWSVSERPGTEWAVVRYWSADRWLGTTVPDDSSVFSRHRRLCILMQQLFGLERSLPSYLRLLIIRMISMFPRKGSAHLSAQSKIQQTCDAQQVMKSTPPTHLSKQLLRLTYRVFFCSGKVLALSHPDSKSTSLSMVSTHTSTTLNNTDGTGQQMSEEKAGEGDQNNGARSCSAGEIIKVNHARPHISL